MKRFGLIGWALAIALTALLMLTTCGRPTPHAPDPPEPPLPDNRTGLPAPATVAYPGR